MTGVQTCVFFFQAEDGIRDNVALLEFRRVLFRSRFNIELGRFNIELPEYDIELERFSVELRQFKIELRQFDIELQRFNIEFSKFKTPIAAEQAENEPFDSKTSKNPVLGCFACPTRHRRDIFVDDALCFSPRLRSEEKYAAPTGLGMVGKPGSTTMPRLTAAEFLKPKFLPMVLPRSGGLNYFQ